ncbi:MAG: putative RND superfamily exporter protein, partial [Verrucomicrobiales bacterium]
MVAAIAVITALLTIPFLTMAPETSASTEPSGDIFTARDLIDESFVSAIHPTLIIAEHESGDVLTVDALGSLLEAEDELRGDAALGSTLVSIFDAESGSDVNGVLTLADLVDAELQLEGTDGIRAATDAQVSRVGSAIIDRLGERSQIVGISAQSSRDVDGWTVPALSLVVLSDNEVLGFGNTSVNLGRSTDIEEFDRDVQAMFRGPSWQANGVAIDVNLNSEEQGAVAGPFIGLTILAVLVLVGLTFRSYWILATVSVSFLALIIWLKGISNLLGFKDDLVLALIVPVAMISFGVDFAFHSLGRYREERVEGRTSGPAIVAGMTAVSGALLLALTSDAMAFLANLTSGIESINQFGFGAAIALASAYLLLGVAAPSVVAKIEGAVPVPHLGRRSTGLRIAGGVAAASMTMTSVLLLVFVLPWLGAILAVFTIILILALPYVVQGRKHHGDRCRLRSASPSCFRRRSCVRERVHGGHRVSADRRVAHRHEQRSDPRFGRTRTRAHSVG